jgi:hypothetical protein
MHLIKIAKNDIVSLFLVGILTFLKVLYLSTNFRPEHDSFAFLSVLGYYSNSLINWGTPPTWIPNLWLGQSFELYDVVSIGGYETLTLLITKVFSISNLNTVFIIYILVSHLISGFFLFKISKELRFSQTATFAVISLFIIFLEPMTQVEFHYRMSVNSIPVLYFLLLTIRNVNINHILGLALSNLIFIFYGRIFYISIYVFYVEIFILLLFLFPYRANKNAFKKLARDIISLKHYQLASVFLIIVLSSLFIYQLFSIKNNYDFVSPGRTLGESKLEFDVFFQYGGYLYWPKFMTLLGFPFTNPDFNLLFPLPFVIFLILSFADNFHIIVKSKIYLLQICTFVFFLMMVYPVELFMRIIYFLPFFNTVRHLSYFSFLFTIVLLIYLGMALSKKNNFHLIMISFIAYAIIRFLQNSTFLNLILVDINSPSTSDYYITNSWIFLLLLFVIVGLLLIIRFNSFKMPRFFQKEFIKYLFVLVGLLDLYSYAISNGRESLKSDFGYFPSIVSQPVNSYRSKDFIFDLDLSDFSSPNSARYGSELLISGVDYCFPQLRQDAYGEGLVEYLMKNSLILHEGNSPLLSSVSAFIFNPKSSSSTEKELIACGENKIQLRNASGLQVGNIESLVIVPNKISFKIDVPREINEIDVIFYNLNQGNWQASINDTNVQIKAHNELFMKLENIKQGDLIVFEVKSFYIFIAMLKFFLVIFSLFFVLLFTRSGVRK